MTAPMRFLICDANLDSRVATRKAVQRGGLAVVGEIGYGVRAVAEARAAEPDAILIAIEEPVALGVDTAQALLNAFPDVPLVVYSSLSDPESIRRAMIIGARDYIIKPLDPARLVKTAEVLIEIAQKRIGREGDPTGHGRGMVITVTGAKGGLGKTVTAVNLALAVLQETNKGVVLVDANTHFGDVATMLDLAPEVNLGNVLEQGGLDRTTVSAFVAKHKTGLDVLAAPPSGQYWEGQTRAEELRGILDVLSEVYDFVIVDTAGSFDKFARVCIESASLVLVITTGEITSIRDTITAIQIMGTWGVPEDRYKVVLNQRVRLEGIRLEDLRRTAIRELFWEIPYDPHVQEAVQTGQPVLQHLNGSIAGHSILDLARRIVGNKALAPVAKQNESFLGGLFKRRKTA